MNIQKDWNATLESAYSFMLKYSKIAVWLCCPSTALINTIRVLYGMYKALSSALGMYYLVGTRYGQIIARKPVWQKRIGKGT